jgi:hypothetical protein
MVESHQERSRGIIFVGYSYGGLVIKQVNAGLFGIDITRDNSA